MKQLEKSNPQAYEAPHVEIMEIAVEQGFTTSEINVNTATEYYGLKEDQAW